MAGLTLAGGLKSSHLGRFWREPPCPAAGGGTQRQGGEMRLIALVLSAWLVSPATAQDDTWIAVGRTDKAAWHVKAGSVSFSEVHGNASTVTVVGRMTVLATSRTTIYK